MPKNTVHSLLYALSHTVSNLILYVDSGELDYKDEVKVDLEDNQLKISKGEETFTNAKLG